MPEIVPERRLPQRSAWTDRGVGRIEHQGHGFPFLLCKYVYRRRLEVGRVKSEGHAFDVSICEKF